MADRQYKNSVTGDEADQKRRALRNALGAFPTGVTVITTANNSGERFGVTANSFTSVSLDPPLVLWSLAKSSNSFAGFSMASHWAVHVLTKEQKELAMRFAVRGAEKFENLPDERGIGDVPLLSGCCARFQCEMLEAHDGGDHMIFIGRVLQFERIDGEALVFFNGNFGIAVDESEKRHALHGAL